MMSVLKLQSLKVAKEERIKEPDSNVVNLSPKALIFQGYRALFFFKKFLIFFLKKT